MEAAVLQQTGTIRCKDCGAVMEFDIDTQKMKCDHCGAEEDLKPVIDGNIRSFDYNDFIKGNVSDTATRDEKMIECSSCGALINWPPDLSADNCPFCAAPLHIEAAVDKKVLNPQYILPFLIDQKNAIASFQQWVQQLWFSPSDLIKKANDVTSRQLQGIYLPHWSYDTRVTALYYGQRGDYYYTTETYTEEEDGQTVTKEREERHTSWTPVSGTVALTFEDLIISASKSLPQKIDDSLKPWKLDELRTFDEEYLSGFRSETYQLDAQQGFEVAKNEMASAINNAICRDIGGDEQSISQCQNTYTDTKLKYVALPIWLSAYRYNDQVYHFFVNACTGHVSGERPYSAFKIFLAVVFGIGVLAFILYALQGNH